MGGQNFNKGLDLKDPCNVLGTKKYLTIFLIIRTYLICTIFIPFNYLN